MLLTVTAAMSVAAEARAEGEYKRFVGDGTVYLTNIPAGPSSQRALFAHGSTVITRPTRSNQRTYSREIAEAAARYAVPARLIWAVIRAESGFDHRAVSRKGACGLMQLMPTTAARLGVRDPFNPRENIHAGTRHLRGLMDRFRSDMPLAIAAYNSGEQAVVTHGGIPPYPETRDYVTKVLRYYEVPIELERVKASSIHRLIEHDGTVTYTNNAPRRI